MLGHIVRFILHRRNLESVTNTRSNCNNEKNDNLLHSLSQVSLNMLIEMTLRCVTGGQLAKRNLSVAGDSIYINVTGEEQAVTSGFMPICKHELYETKAYR
jgi:hypothetical protein